MDQQRASVAGMESVAGVLSLVTEIDRKALTYRVMPGQIDSKISAARQLTDPGAAEAAALFQDYAPRRSSASSSRGGGARAVLSGRTRRRGSAGLSTIDLHGTLNDPDIARQEATTILAGFGISLEEPSSRLPSAAAAGLPTSASSGPGNTPPLDQSVTVHPPSQPKLYAGGTSMMIDGGGSALWGESAILEEVGRAPTAAAGAQVPHFAVTSAAAEMSTWSLGLNEAHHHHPAPMPTPPPAFLENRRLGMGGSSLLETPSVSLPLIRTLGESELSQISRMPKANDMELHQFRSISEKFIDSEILPDDPYSKIAPKWRNYKYQGLMQGRDINNTPVVSASVADALDAQHTSAMQQRHHTTASMPNLSTSLPTTVANTHHRVGLAPLEVMPRKRAGKERHHKNNTHASNRPSSSVMRPPSTDSQGDTIGFLGIQRSELSMSSEDSSRVLRAHLDAARLREQKITSNLRLRLFRYRQKVPLAMQGPQGGMARVAAILRAAQGRRVMQMCVALFNHWKDLHNSAKRKEILEAALIVQCAYRARRARKEWKQRLEAMRRQEREKKRLENEAAQRSADASTKIQATWRRFASQRLYEELRTLSAAARVVQRSFRASRARHGLFLRIVGRKHIESNATILQCWWRVVLARNTIHVLRRIRAAEEFLLACRKRERYFEDFFQMAGAAARVQLWWRACLLMLKAQRRVKALKFRYAMTIQRYYRGYAARVGPIAHKRERKKKRDEVLGRAASKIQKCWRIYRGRSHMRAILKKRDEARERRVKEKEALIAKYSLHGDDGQRKGVGKLAGLGMRKAGRFLTRGLQSVVNPGREEQAALKIQSAWRMRCAREQGIKRQQLFLKQRKNRVLREAMMKASTRIQAWWRGIVTRRVYGSLRGDAAISIQTVWRFYHSRQWYKRTISDLRAQRSGAAIVIQNAYRSYKGRTDYLLKIMRHRKRLPAAIIVQKYWRRAAHGRWRWGQMLEEKKRMHEQSVIGESGVRVLRKCLADWELIRTIGNGKTAIRFLLQRCFHAWCQDEGENTDLGDIADMDEQDLSNEELALKRKYDEQQRNKVNLDQLMLFSGSKFKNFLKSAYLSVPPPGLKEQQRRAKALKKELADALKTGAVEGGVNEDDGNSAGGDRGESVSVDQKKEASAATTADDAPTVRRPESSSPDNPDNPVQDDTQRGRKKTSKKGSKSKGPKLALPVNELDTLFAQCKTKGDRGLSFNTFVSFLRAASDKLYGSGGMDHYLEVVGEVDNVVVPPSLEDKTLLEYSYAALRREQPREKRHRFLKYNNSSGSAADVATGNNKKKKKIRKNERLSREEKKKRREDASTRLHAGPELESEAAPSGRKLAPWLVGFAGSDARLLRLLHERVLKDKTLTEKWLKHQEGDSLMQRQVPLGSAGIHAQADKIIVKAALIVQNRWRGVEARASYMSAREHAEAMQTLKLKMHAAAILQTRIARPFLARRRMQRAAADVYIEYECKDEGSKGRQWYNPRTRKLTSPFPPKLLTLRAGRKGAKRTACIKSVLPRRDRMFVLTCSQCEDDGDDTRDKSAVVFCKDCSEAFCERCHEDFHHIGKRLNHSFRKIPKCGECQMWDRPPPYDDCQIATLHIRFARKKEKKKRRTNLFAAKTESAENESQYLCDECWHQIVLPKLEAEGRDNETLTKRLVAPCVWCNDYAARWSCQDCTADSNAAERAFKGAHRLGAQAVVKETKKKEDGNGAESKQVSEDDTAEEMEADLYCSQCYDDTHGHGHRTMHRAKPVPYYPMVLQMQELKTLRDRNAKRKYKQQAKDAARRKKEADRKDGAVLIQACWRRYAARSKHLLRQREKRIKAHEAWAQRVKDDIQRKKCSYKTLSVFGMEPSLASDDFRRTQRWQRKMATKLGVGGKIYISQSEQFRKGQQVVIRHKGHPYDFSRGEIMSTVKNHHTNALVFLFDLSKVAEVKLEHVHVPTGFYERLVRQKKAEMNSDHLASRSWFGMDLIPTWSARERFVYEFKKKRKLKIFNKEVKKIESEKKEKLELAQRQAEKDGKTLEEFLPPATLAALRRPTGDAGHPKFFAPLRVRCWTDSVNHTLDLREAAEWESSVLRDTNEVVWRNVKDGTKRRCKPNVLVKSRDVAWRYTVGNAKEFYRMRTIQGYNRIHWDHGAERSQLAKAAQKREGGGGGGGEEGGANGGASAGNLASMMGKVDELNDGLTEDDPDWVLPWAEEEDPSGEPGKTVWVRRRKADGEIIKRSEEVPDDMLSKEMLNKKQVEAKADEASQKEAKEKALEMQVAKEKRAREKRNRQRRKKK